jgi:hypothetical protein
MERWTAATAFMIETDHAMSPEPGSARALQAEKEFLPLYRQLPRN